MRQLTLSLILGFAVVLSAIVPAAYGQNAKAKKSADRPVLKTNRDKASYAIGLQIGQALKRQGLEIDPKLLAAGISDTLSGKKPALTDQQLQAALAEFQKEMQAQAAAKSKAAAEKNKKAGVAFLAANAKKTGVKTTKSGLQYSVLRAGKGVRPKATDTVEVHYRGKLIDGSVFDESFKGKVPAKADQTVKFAANRVIKGWTEALQLMNVGSVYRLVIPSELGYGTRGAGQDIGPNSVLVFEVHLLGIEASKKK
ncbi:MAG: FKBP-type peptidyl-prolyl cis-trans isomerase [Planctomycetota bacterium]|nr:FKBP-type peptidyl-prolyl cis-trans isomerase [Planctomycetota bacterium]